MEFKLGDIVTYKDSTLVQEYIVVSENPNDFWLRSKEKDNVFLRYNPSEMKKAF